jgi:tRNA G10  N-methylase Trm11
MISAKLLPHLRDHELKALARSKNVSGAVSKAARNQLEKKNIKI